MTMSVFMRLYAYVCVYMLYLVKIDRYVYYSIGIYIYYINTILMLVYISMILCVYILCIQ